MKQCTNCCEYKDPTTDFHKNAKASDGLKTQCKGCIKKYNALTYSKTRRVDYRESSEYKLRSKAYRSNPTNKERKNSNEKRRRKTDPIYKLTHNLRTLLNMSLRKVGFRKESRTYQLLGANYETVHQHLADTAVRNYGFYDPNEPYHIDHIVPCASATTPEELIKLQHYSNLQYLTPEDNLKKSNKLNWSISCQNR